MRWVLVLAVVAILAGCGGDDPTSTTQQALDAATSDADADVLPLLPVQDSQWIRERPDGWSDSWR